MDLAVTLPLAALLLVQLLLSALLLAPRALSRHVAALLALSRSSPVVQAVVATVAVAVLAITGSSLIQFWGVSAAMSSQQFGDRWDACERASARDPAREPLPLVHRNNARAGSWR